MDVAKFDKRALLGAISDCTYYWLTAQHTVATITDNVQWFYNIQKVMVPGEADILLQTP